MDKLYTKEDMRQAENAGRAMMKTHNEPSPETRERLTKLETMQTNFMQEIQEIKTMIKDLSLDVKEALDGKANKWVEKVMVSVGASIGLGILGLAGWAITESIKRWQ